MPESYKTWILIGIAFFVGIFFTIIVINPSLKNRDVAERGLQDPAPPPPQFTGSNQTKVLPVEELMVDITDPQSLASLGDQYFESSNYEQAIELYKKALEINPNDADTLNDLGLAYLYTGNSDLAEEVLIKGTAIDPEFQRIWLTFGFVLKSAGKNEEAISVLQKTVDMGPNNDIGLEASKMLGEL
jgi:tetratricopeptide (TPR) repeat protein